MFLFTKPQLQQLVKNGQPDQTGKDHFPVVKLFIRRTGMIWLLSEIDPENPAIGFGLYDLNIGFPCTGKINIENLMKEDRGIERDPYFTGRYPLSVYTKAAHSMGYITEVDALLINKYPRPEI